MNRTISVVFTELDNPHHASSLLAMLNDYAEDVMGGGRPLDDYVRRHLIDELRARRDFCGFLAFHAARPVGMINCFEGFSTFAARPLLNVHDLAVIADYRGRGIGDLLLGAAERHARLRGCCKLTLEVLSRNQRALTLYQHNGYQPYSLDPATGQALFLQKPL